MEVFIGRQPILNRNGDTVAYELLYRSNPKENKYNAINGENATLSVIANSFITMGIENITDGKTTYVNFTEELIKKNIPHMLPIKNVVIEVLENVTPSKEILDKCKTLKSKGYTIALDDFIISKEYNALIDVADIIKVDFLATKGIERKRIIERLKTRNIRFLAEKVETYDDFKEAMEYGYVYFQGYYFCRPDIISGRDIPVSKLNSINIMNEIYSRNINLEHLESIIMKDVSLSYKFLKLINSSSFGFKSRVTSIKHAIALIGERDVVNWLYLIALRGLTEDKPSELLKISLIRAKFGELLCNNTKFKEKSFEVYMMGMISMVDVLLDMELEEVLNEIYIGEDIKLALLGVEENIFYYIYKLIYNYERAQWDKVEYYCKKINIDKKELYKMYIESVEWVNMVIYM
ncbi:EAL and HDOD domain-containing protein [Hathewaya massiliensis]|uniref:EAL and HDOD domain-containing protein n=1 Tax=Hathewaya massiliensis TaxID=1964382 RepID=UPI00115872EA|nr:HDOD domain-containing protein [Hathewaya massiliensis]